MFNMLLFWQSNYGKPEDFLLFASVHECTMVEKKAADKPVFIEISMGNAGNCLDGTSASKSQNELEDSDEDSGMHFYNFVLSVY